MFAVLRLLAVLLALLLLTALLFLFLTLLAAQLALLLFGKIAVIRLDENHALRVTHRLHGAIRSRISRLQQHRRNRQRDRGKQFGSISHNVFLVSDDPIVASGESVIPGDFVFQPQDPIRHLEPIHTG